MTKPKKPKPETNKPSAPEPKSKSVFVPTLIAFIAGVFVCALILTIKEQNRYKQPPPGWIITNSHVGCWGFLPKDYLNVSWTPLGSDKPIATKQEAIDSAWESYKIGLSIEEHEARK